MSPKADDLYNNNSVTAGAGKGSKGLTEFYYGEQVSQSSGGGGSNPGRPADENLGLNATLELFLSDSPKEDASTTVARRPVQASGGRGSSGGVTNDESHRQPQHGSHHRADLSTSDPVPSSLSTTTPCCVQVNLLLHSTTS